MLDDGLGEVGGHLDLAYGNLFQDPGPTRCGAAEPDLWHAEGGVQQVRARSRVAAPGVACATPNTSQIAGLPKIPLFLSFRLAGFAVVRKELG